MVGGKKMNQPKFEIGEEWRKIKFLNNKYEVSSLGRIRNTLTGAIRKTPVGKRGYPVFSCNINGKNKLVTVHKCVAMEFILNSKPNNKIQVNHIDGNKTNNCVENLEWVTCFENSMHARLTGLHKSDGDKAVLQIKNGEIIQEYKSASEASRKTGVGRANICNVCNKRVSNGKHCITAGGYIWRWKNESKYA